MEHGYILVTEIKKSIFCCKREGECLKTWFKEFKSKVFIVIVCFAYNGELKEKRAHRNIKISFSYYQNNILLPVCEEEMPSLYPHTHRIVTSTIKKPCIISQEAINQEQIKTIQEAIHLNLFLNSWG